MINLNELRQTNPQLASNILQNPLTTLPTLPPSHITGTTGTIHTPRTLNSTHLNTLVVVEGIICQLKSKKAKIQKSVFEKENVRFEKEFYDFANPFFPTTHNFNVPESEQGLSTFVENEIFVLQEDLQSARIGHIPHSIECVMEGSGALPGARIRAYAVYRAVCNKNLHFSSVLVVLNYSVIDQTNYNVQIDNYGGMYGCLDLKAVFTTPFLHKMVSSMFCPSIYGHSNIKLAIVLQILGGNEIQKESVRVRGDINILLVGDPGTGKSQLLRFVPNLTTARIVTGRGLTQAGLTAAVIDGRIEVGAMILCNGGICCIDEFDKIGEDVLILHEVMEQQSISISKGGIHCSLDAKCGVLAAANPILGRFDETKTVEENCNVIDTLLSRFDLVFIVKDTVENDAEIAMHVLNSELQTTSEDTTTNIDLIKNEKNLNVSSFAFNLNEHIKIAKALKPKVCEEAEKLLIDEYVNLRKKGTDRLVCPRTLESLIRIATAHAKLRLSEFVEKEDVLVAIDLMLKKNRSVGEVLREFKEGGKESITFKEICDAVGTSVNVREELQKLSERDVILFCDDLVYFV